MNSQPDAYLTIAAPAQAAVRIRNSRFIAFACHVSSAEEAAEHIARIRREYHDARHVCYAYLIGGQNAASRCFDDGEPSGTAGKPILGQILGARLTNVLTAVVRYFGGTLLGTAGLAAAYRSAAKMALDNAPKAERFWTEPLCVIFEAAQTSRIMQLIKTEGAQITAQTFDPQYRLCVSVRQSRAQALREKLSALGAVQ